MVSSVLVTKAPSTRLGRAQVWYRYSSVAALALAIVGDAGGYHAFHGEARLIGISAGGEGFVFRAEEAAFGKAPLGGGHDHLGRNQAGVAVIVAFE